MYIYCDQLKAWVIDNDGDGILDAIRPSEDSRPLSFFGQSSVGSGTENQLDLSVLDPEIVNQYFSQACGPLRDVRICPFLDYIHFVAVAKNYHGQGNEFVRSEYLYKAFLAAREAQIPECLLINGVKNFVELENRDPEFSLMVAIHLYLEGSGEEPVHRADTRRQREQRINEALFEQTTRLCDLITSDRNGLVDWSYAQLFSEDLFVSTTYGLSLGPFTSTYTGRAAGPYVLSEDVLKELEQYVSFVQRSQAGPEVKAFALEQVARALSEFVHQQVVAARDMMARGQMPSQTAFWQDLTGQLIRLPAPLLQSVANTYSTSYDVGLIMTLYCGEYAVF